MISVLEFDQVVDIGSRVDRKPIRQWNAKLKRQEERILSAPCEDRETCSAGAYARSKMGLYLA